MSSRTLTDPSSSPSSTAELDLGTRFPEVYNSLISLEYGVPLPGPDSQHQLERWRGAYNILQESGCHNIFRQQLGRALYQEICWPCFPDFASDIQIVLRYVLRRGVPLIARALKTNTVATEADGGLPFTCVEIRRVPDGGDLTSARSTDQLSERHQIFILRVTQNLPWLETDVLGCALWHDFYSLSQNETLLSEIKKGTVLTHDTINAALSSRSDKHDTTTSERPSHIPSRSLPPTAAVSRPSALLTFNRIITPSSPQTSSLQSCITREVEDDHVPCKLSESPTESLQRFFVAGQSTPPVRCHDEDGPAPTVDPDTIVVDSFPLAHTAVSVDHAASPATVAGNAPTKRKKTGKRSATTALGARPAKVRKATQKMGTMSSETRRAELERDVDGCPVPVTPSHLASSRQRPVAASTRSTRSTRRPVLADKLGVPGSSGAFPSDHTPDSDKGENVVEEEERQQGSLDDDLRALPSEHDDGWEGMIHDDSASDYQPSEASFGHLFGDDQAEDDHTPTWQTRESAGDASGSPCPLPAEDAPITRARGEKAPVKGDILDAPPRKGIGDVDTKDFDTQRPKRVRARKLDRSGDVKKEHSGDSGLFTSDLETSAIAFDPDNLDIFPDDLDSSESMVAGEGPNYTSHNEGFTKNDIPSGKTKTQFLTGTSCPGCGDVFNSSKAYQSMTVNDRYHCNGCVQRFRKSGTVNRRWKISDRSGLGGTQCPGCKREFTTTRLKSARKWPLDGDSHQYYCAACHRRLRAYGSAAAPSMSTAQMSGRGVSQGAVCSHCDKVFSYAAFATARLRKDSAGRTVFECDQCVIDRAPAGAVACLNPYCNQILPLSSGSSTGGLCQTCWRYSTRHDRQLRHPEMRTASWSITQAPCKAPNCPNLIKPGKAGWVNGLRVCDVCSQYHRRNGIWRTAAVVQRSLEKQARIKENRTNPCRCQNPSGQCSRPAQMWAGERRACGPCRRYWKKHNGRWRSAPGIRTSRGRTGVR